MINASDCRQAVELISEAVKEGAALYKACRELGISKRTYNCWKNTDNDYIDKRTTCERPEPQNKMTQEEKQRILEICNSEEFASMTPGEIVPILTDRGTYVASESTFYKVLREAKQLKHRGREHRKNKSSNVNPQGNRAKRCVDVGHNIFKRTHIGKTLLSVYVFRPVQQKDSWLGSVGKRECRTRQ